MLKPRSYQRRTGLDLSSRQWSGYRPREGDVITDLLGAPKAITFWSIDRFTGFAICTPLWWYTVVIRDLSVERPGSRGPIPIPEDVRFWRLVDRSGGPDACWPWLGMKDRRGYGRFRHGSSVDDSRVMVGAHRMALTLDRGCELGDAHALHHCDNPPCCNPGHLFDGTNADNMADRDAKGRCSQPPRRQVQLL